MNPDLLNPDGVQRVRRYSRSDTVGDASDDGILIRRYIAGKDPASTDDALHPGDPSARPTWQDIWNFLDTFNPLMPVPAAGSTSLRPA